MALRKRVPMISINHHTGPIDERPGTVEQVIAELLYHYWEDPNEVGFILRDEENRNVAMLSTIRIIAECDGYTEVYKVGDPIPCIYHVRYLLDENGKYLSTEVDRTA